MRKLSYGPASALIAVLLLIPACGQQHAGAGAGQAATPSIPASATATCGGAPLVASHGSTISLDTSDNGKTLCLRRGRGVLVILQGTSTSTWSPIHASSTALVPRANGHLMLARGATGAYFVAAHPGTSVIYSSRAICGHATPAATASPAGTMSCGSRQVYRVTLVVVT